jgi:uncharacterized protein with PIN domain
MPESIRLYLDQMLQTRVAQVLRQAGYDVLRASETGQSRADDQEILRSNSKSSCNPFDKSRKMGFDKVEISSVPHYSPSIWLLPPAV